MIGRTNSAGGGNSIKLADTITTKLTLGEDINQPCFVSRSLPLGSTGGSLTSELGETNVSTHVHVIHLTMEKIIKLYVKSGNVVAKSIDVSSGEAVSSTAESLVYNGTAACPTSIQVGESKWMVVAHYGEKIIATFLILDDDGNPHWDTSKITVLFDSKGNSNFEPCIVEIKSGIFLCVAGASNYSYSIRAVTIEISNDTINVLSTSDLGITSGYQACRGIQLINLNGAIILTRTAVRSSGSIWDYYAQIVNVSDDHRTITLGTALTIGNNVGAGGYSYVKDRYFIEKSGRVSLFTTSTGDAYYLYRIVLSVANGVITLNASNLMSTTLQARQNIGLMFFNGILWLVFKSTVNSAMVFNVVKFSDLGSGLVTENSYDLGVSDGDKTAYGLTPIIAPNYIYLTIVDGNYYERKYEYKPVLKKAANDISGVILSKGEEGEVKKCILITSRI